MLYNLFDLVKVVDRFYKRHILQACYVIKMSNTYYIRLNWTCNIE